MISIWALAIVVPFTAIATYGLSESIPGFCIHKWSKWNETRGLSVAIVHRGEWLCEENYRRFERKCEKCGRMQFNKEKTN